MTETTGTTLSGSGAEQNDSTVRDNPASQPHAAAQPRAAVQADPAAWLDALHWDERGLVPAIAQDASTGRVLMMAWMNREALLETARTGRAVYWSRSRNRLWRKGEESGNVQHVHELRTDCDCDAILLAIEQVGGVACHTGRESCFFRRLDGVPGPAAVFGAGDPPATGNTFSPRWENVDPVRVDPATLYGDRAHHHE